MRYGHVISVLRGFQRNFRNDVFHAHLPGVGLQSVKAQFSHALPRMLARNKKVILTVFQQLAAGA